MGNNSGKRQNLTERIVAAQARLRQSFTEQQIEEVRTLLVAIRKEVGEIDPEPGSELQQQVAACDKRIDAALLALQERQRVARADREKAERLAYARKARAAFEQAGEKRERDLEWTVKEIASLERRKPQTGAIASQDRSVTAEGIQELLESRRAEKTRLEQEAADTATWKDDDVLRWFQATEDKKRLDFEAQERKAQQQHAKRNDPRLASALQRMSDSLKFSVDGCAARLLGADLDDILSETLPNASAEVAALQGFHPAEATVSTTERVLSELREVFPAGAVREAAEKVIREFQEFGAGAGARLRAKSAPVVVAAYAAGFDIQDKTVLAFLKEVVRAIVSGMPSDSGGEGPLYRGEFSSQ